MTTRPTSLRSHPLHRAKPIRSRLILSIVLLVSAVLLSIPAHLAQQAVSAQATPVASTSISVFDLTLHDLPPAPVFAGVARLSFPPGSSILGGPIAGARLFLVETGAFAVALDDPAVVLRQGSAEAQEAIDASGEATLEPGDILVVTGIPPFTVTNVSDNPATLLDIVIWPPVNELVRPFVTENGVIFEPLVIGDLVEMPDWPVRLHLEQVSLPLNAEMPYELGSGPQMIYVDSGRMGIRTGSGMVSYSSAAANAPGSVTGRIRTLDPGRDAVLTAGGSVILQTGASGSLSNLGRAELDLLVLSFEPLQ